MDSVDISESDNNDTSTKDKAAKTNAAIKESDHNSNGYDSDYNDNYSVSDKIIEETQAKDETNDSNNKACCTDNESTENCNVGYQGS